MNNTPIVVFDSNDQYFDMSPSVYPDNMPIISPSVSPEEVSFILVRPVTLTDFMAAMFWVDSYRERTGKRLSLVLPSIPGARQDRLNSQGDCLFTAKSIAKEINMRYFKQVIVLDPHSEVAPALIDRCKVYHIYESQHVVKALDCREYDCIVSPDAGAEKRASGVARKLNIPLVHAWKTRNIKNGSLSGFGIEPSISFYRNALIVDDICDGGGTFMGLAATIKGNSPSTKCDLFVTHGLFSKGTKDLLSSFSNIFCTDSMLQAFTAKGVNIINICEKLF